MLTSQVIWELIAVLSGMQAILNGMQNALIEEAHKLLGVGVHMLPTWHASHDCEAFLLNPHLDFYCHCPVQTAEDMLKCQTECVWESMQAMTPLTGLDRAAVCSSIN